jgi:hypothetical protein
MCANLHSDLACCFPVTEVLYETRTVSLHKSLAFILPKLPPKCTETRKGIAVNDKTVNFVMILPQFGLDGPDICEIWGSHGDEYEYDCPLGCWDLMMEAVGTSETSISIQQTKWRNIPEDSHRRPDDTHVEGTCISGTWAPCCRVLLEKLTVAQLLMKCTAFCRDWRFVTVFRGPAPPPIPWPHARTYTHYFDIPPSSFMRTYRYIVYIPDTCYMSRPSDPIWLFHPNNIQWEVQIMKFHIVQFCPFFCYFISYRPCPKFILL